ncbi:Acetyl-coenzyme A synthetase [Roseibacterium elongatum DSM 19469]|uniref:Acetyl-coenzyme A synthetase n=1 Tax=Roseicyclus elongatus DSM 19469 TaxID=1294273 RepID=W8SPC9_9RHOB|nr:AMP-binding protein [Roseibacterium elongatum]AHM04385.1 Acetyl-coenzyme A synthetase [Roseibacterium elongatum DSM 19469]
MADLLSDRRLFARPARGRADWQKLRGGFQWRVPSAMNIADLCCDAWAALAPDRAAVIHVTAEGAREVWTYGDLKRASDRLAAAMAAAGIMRGDRVAVLMAQHPAVLITHFAAMKLGAVSLPLFTLFGEDALRYRLADSGARAIVCDAAQIDKVTGLRPQLPALDLIISTGQGAAPVRALDDILDTPAPGFRPVPTDAEDPAVMIYTSGTTGDPKGVLHAHRFLYGHLPCMELSQNWFPQTGDVGWTPADWAWIGGLMDMAMPCLFYGVPLVSHRFAKFDSDAALRLMAQEGVTNAFIPPTALRMMHAAVVPDDLRLRAIGSGGEPLGADLLDWGRARLRCPINEFYGQTEANLVIASCDRMMDRVPGAMGLPVPGHEVAVLGPGDTPVAAGEVGEVCVRAPDPVMFLEYWGKPEATQDKVIDGWLRTGDLALLREDGQMVFHARDDDIITSAGYRIGPVEIEQALVAHPDVVMAAVVGAPDPVRTQVVVAHVVLRDGAEWSGLPERLKALVRDKVSAHVVPRKIYRAETLPMTATGKILRRALREG